MKFKKILTKFLACSLAVCSIIGSTITADAASAVTNNGVYFNNIYSGETYGPVIGGKYVFEKDEKIKIAGHGPISYVVKKEYNPNSNGISTVTANVYDQFNKNIGTETFKIQRGVKRHASIGVYAHKAGASSITTQISTWDIGGKNMISNTVGLKLQGVSDYDINKKVAVYYGNVKIKVRNVNNATTTIYVPFTYSEIYSKNTKNIAIVGSGLTTDVVIGKSAMSLKNSNSISTKLPSVGDNINRYIMINGK